MNRLLKKIVRWVVLNPLETLSVLLMWGLLRLLGRRNSINFMGWVGRTFGPCLKRPTNIARKNLRRVFPHKSELEIETLIKGVWDSLGRVSAEYAFFNHMDIHDSDQFEIVGQEHVQSLKNDGKPGILVGAHLANWVVASITTAKLGLPVTQIYRRFNNPFYDWMVNRAQKKIGITSHWKGAQGGREAYKALKDGGHLVLFTDQKLREGIPVPFFGMDAMTAPAAARLALKLDCPIVPVRVERLQGFKFRVTYFPPLAYDKSKSIHENIPIIMAEINHQIEAWIRETPEQWLWIHNRWPKK